MNTSKNYIYNSKITKKILKTNNTKNYLKKCIIS